MVYYFLQTTCDVQGGLGETSSIDCGDTIISKNLKIWYCAKVTGRD